jgi:hypothetical protein
VLIREVNARALAAGYFQCGTCQRTSLGTAANASMKRRTEAAPRVANHGKHLS